MRCLTLAEEMRRRGAAPEFFMRTLVGSAAPLIEGRGFPIWQLSAEEDFFTLAGQSAGSIAWTVLDHYQLGAAWEAQAGRYGPVFVIDDLGGRPHDCAVLLDQRFFSDARDRHQPLVGPRTRLLLGPRYALLRPTFAAQREACRPIADEARRLFVLFGGTDPTNETTKVIESLSGFGLEATVVCGASFVHLDAVREAARRATVQLVIQSDDVASLMAQADLGVGAVGLTTWERLCVGLPSLAAIVAENQREPAVHLAAREYIDVLAGGNLPSVNDYRQGIEALAADSKKRARRSAAGRELVDGRGVERAADVLMEAV